MAYKSYNDVYRRYREVHQRKVRASCISDIMDEIRATNKAVTNNPWNKFIWERGIQWYNDGHALDEADDSIRNNSNFIKGFELAMRQDTIRKDLESQGAQWFYCGESLENASPRLQNSVNFIKGYNDAKNGVNVFDENSCKTLVKNLK